MIIPSYWAEAKKQHVKAGKQITVRRFGWSENTQEEAERMAVTRAEDALRQILSGQKLAKQEFKVAYNGAQGVPIREEVLARHGDVVITRNSYGAKCLNTPDVLFADVDFDFSVSFKLKFATFCLLIGGIAWFIKTMLPELIKTFNLFFNLMTPDTCNSYEDIITALITVILVMVAIFIVSPFVDLVNRVRIKSLGGIEKIVRNRILIFLKTHPAWNLRLYKTPAGFRLIATQQLFKSIDKQVLTFFHAIGTDPMYIQMCLNQHCFRARLTAKPWRIGISSHMKPRPGVWPVNPERLEERATWLAAYDLQTQGFGACQFLEELGSGKVDQKVQSVIALHDKESKATLPNIKIA